MLLKLFAFLLIISSNLYSYPNEITFVRHAEAYHNKAFLKNEIKKAKSIIDPELTEKGKEQSFKDQEILKGKNFDVIFTSPLSRAIETAILIAHNKNTPIIVLPQISEYCLGLNCKLSDINKLKKTFPNVDFSLLTPKWIHELNHEIEAGFLNRVSDFANYLKSLTYNNVLIVSHSGFLKKLLNKKFSTAEIYTILFSPYSSNLNN